MKCLVCLQEIQPGDSVLYGAAAIYSGPGEYDFDHIEAQSDLEGVVHLFCLDRPGEIAETPNTGAHEPVQEESGVVTRSDALSLFNS